MNSPRNPAPVEPIVRSWLLAREADNASPKTLTAYRGAVLDLAASLRGEPRIARIRKLVNAGEMTAAKADTAIAEIQAGTKTLAEADHDDITRWLGEMLQPRPQRRLPRGQERPLQAATRRLHFSTVRAFYKWVIADGRMGITHNPTANIKVPKLSADLFTPTVTLEQARMLVTVPGTSFLARRDCALFYVMLDSGLRRAEVHRLTVDDIDLDDGAVYVKGKKSNLAERTRVGQLGIKARQAVDRYLAARSKRPYAAQHDALWLSSWGNGALTHSGFQAIFERHGKRIGVKLHPHMLRHTWASQFRKGGGSEGDLLVLGGWSSRAMLDRYGKADAVDRARDAYRKLSVTDRLR